MWPTRGIVFGWTLTITAEPYSHSYTSQALAVRANVARCGRGRLIELVNLDGTKLDIERGSAIWMLRDEFNQRWPPDERPLPAVDPAICLWSRCRLAWHPTEQTPCGTGYDTFALLGYQ